MSKNIKVKLADAEALANTLSKQLKGGETLGLTGPLGSGKTTFTKALAKHLHVKTHVTSPTFVVMNRYLGRINRRNIYIYHLDLYRTKGLREVKALGLAELWGQPNTVVVIEWAEKINKILPPKTIKIKFSH
jgi:tRNA threonylcarbamoyladenosine biosynthesis protein TsaE